MTSWWRILLYESGRIDFRPSQWTGDLDGMAWECWALSLREEKMEALACDFAGLITRKEERFQHGQTCR